MPLKIVPYSETEDGRWAGKFGRYEVTIRKQVGAQYWRGPDKELVLETEGVNYSYSVRGSHTGTAYTLAGAMERGEKDCLELHNANMATADRRYAMTDEQRAAEDSAHDSYSADAVEADRIAHSRGWELAMDVLPELKAFAERQGLYPLPNHQPRPGF